MNIELYKVAQDIVLKHTVQLYWHSSIKISEYKRRKKLGEQELYKRSEDERGSE